MSEYKIAFKINIEIAIMICALGMTAIWGACWFHFYSKFVKGPPFKVEDIIVLVIFFASFRFYASAYKAFKISIKRVSEMTSSQILALIISDVNMYLLAVLLCKQFPPVLPILVTFIIQSFYGMIWAFGTHKWFFSHHPPKKTVVVWDVRTGLSELIDFYGLENRYQLMGKVYAKQCVEDLDKYLEGAEAVFFSGVHSHDRNIIIKYCINNDIDTYIIPRVGDMIMRAAKPLHLFYLPVLKLERYSPSIQFLAIKRFGDIFVSGLALIILSPIMIVVAIAIKATDGGTVLYQQCRLTQDGKKFNLLKFRSMRMDAEKDGIARLSSGTDDDRITPIGRFIRATRLDEMPQLINILKGDMAIVGPRPERPEIFEEYVKEMPEFALRLQAKAGLTGEAQVYGKYNTTPYDKLLLDLLYISNPSLVRDFLLCIATVKVLFMPESTEGISSEQTNAMNDGSFIEENMEIQEDVNQGEAQNENENI